MRSRKRTRSSARGSPANVSRRSSLSSRRNGKPTPAATLITSWRGSNRHAHFSRKRSVPDPHSTYDYAVIRVVPRVEREEFVNVGVIVSCPERDFLDCRIEVDEARLRALHPAVDLDTVRRHLASIPAICRGGDEAGPIGKLT